MTHEFISNVEQQHKALGRFIDLLAREQALLGATPLSIDTLSRITEQKAAQAAELESLDAARQNILLAHGYTADRAGAERLAEQLDCAALWQAFIERVRDAQTENRANGLSIDMKLDFTQRALAFVQRITGHTLYGPNGQKRALGGKSIQSSV